MPDKCQAHDSCVGRIHDNISEMRDEFRQGHNDMKEMLHNGAIIHATLDMRVTTLEKAHKERGFDWKGQFLRLGFGLLEKGVIILFAMAYYAHMNGFGK